MTREEAIEVIKRTKGAMVYTEKEKEALETLIPELAESEDERIRRWLCDYFSSIKKMIWIHRDITCEQILDWLEKQKDSVSNNFDDVWNEEDCEEIIAEGQKLTPRFKELLKEVCHAWYDRGAKLEKQKSGLSFVGDFQAKTLQGPIELAEWKEAAKIREWILAKMQELAATGVPCSDEIKMADKAIDYLIKQKEYIEEPKIAFGDWGDKEKKEAIITCLKYMRFIKKITNQEYDDLIKWLANNTISNVSEKEKCLREVKQKEQNSVDEQFPPLNGLDAIKAKYYDDGFKNGFDEGVASVKPAEWSEEDEKIRQSIIKDIEFERNFTFAETGKVIEKYDEQVKWLKSLPLNLKKKNEDIAKLCSNEWSEEDKAHRDFILESLENQIRFCKKDAKGAHYTKQIRTAQNWLKSLPERFNFESKPAECNKVTINGEPIPTENHSVDIPLAEWSDEDEKTIDDAFCWLCEYAGSLIQKNYGKSSMLYGIANKLKSIHPQYHGDVTMTEAYKMGKEAGEASRWKPTEHQMTILKAVKEYVGKGSGYWGEGLGSLINDLEKL